MNILEQRGYQSFVKLDSGGQANVYKTIKNGQLYAMKVVRVECPNSPNLDDDLKRELQIVRNLKHPNCIHVEEMFRTKNKIYIIMDYMPNGTIGTISRNSGPLCEWNVKLWFCPVARAIKYLHDNHIAHRDLKLDNILLDQFLNPILSDFGFSRFVAYNENGQVQYSNTYCGTVSFNAPEILNRTIYDPYKADIWSCGVMLFIMINQFYPFDRRNRSLMYKNQMSRNYHLQEHIDKRTSDELKDLINTLLEPNPSLRPNIDDVCNHVWFPIIMNEKQFTQLQ